MSFSAATASEGLIRRVKLGNYVAVVKHPSTTWINVEVKAAKRDGAPGSAIPAAAPIPAIRFNLRANVVKEKASK
jgi:hypothetical protein